MNIKLIAHTQLSTEFFNECLTEELKTMNMFKETIKDGQIISLVAIRNCYSPNRPTEIVSLEGEKYFGQKATDGKSGTEADRLFRHIVKSGHRSTLEHLNYTFAIEGVSRALLAQLTRHRHLSFSVESQRYVKLGSNDKSGGFNYVIPPTIEKNFNKKILENAETGNKITVGELYESAMKNLQDVYDDLRRGGVTAEEARSILPNAATTNIVMTGNLRTLLEFYTKRKPGKGAQYEITQLAEGIKSEILKVDEWLTPYFE